MSRLEELLKIYLEVKKQKQEKEWLGRLKWVKGDKGEDAPAVKHRWDGTSVQFTDEKGDWGPLVDLKGPEGRSHIPEARWEGSKLTFLRADGTWTEPVELKGKDGKNGRDGKDGKDGLSIKGDAGERGPMGPAGPKGDKGETGPKGEKGDAGESPLVRVYNGKFQYKNPGDADWSEGIKITRGTGNGGSPVAIAADGNLVVQSTNKINFIGANIVNRGTQIDVQLGGALWKEVSSHTLAEPNKGYICNAASEIELKLPAVAELGSTLEIVKKGTGNVKIAQGHGQQIHFSDFASTTIGATGYMQISQRYAPVKLLCITANAEWVVVQAIDSVNIQ